MIDNKPSEELISSDEKNITFDELVIKIRSMRAGQQKEFKVEAKNTSGTEVRQMLAFFVIKYGCIVTGNAEDKEKGIWRVDVIKQ